MNYNLQIININEFFKKDIGLFPEEQELMVNLGLYFDTDIEEHFEYFNFTETSKHKIQEEFQNIIKVLNDPVLLDSIEQFWFANKAGTSLERSLINHLFSKIPKDLPIGEIYVVFDSSYISFQIVFMPNNIFPYLTTIMLIQNETLENQEYINQLLDRFSLNNLYNELKNMKI